MAVFCAHEPIGVESVGSQNSIFILHTTSLFFLFFEFSLRNMKSYISYTNVSKTFVLQGFSDGDYIHRTYTENYTNYT